jgi:hypothetical protein
LGVFFAFLPPQSSILLQINKTKGVIFMNVIEKKTYDPHLLYHAINITVDLEYKVPMQRVYDILEILDENKEGSDELQVDPKEVETLINTLGSALENSLLTNDPDENTNLQSKIKELLRLLGCVLSDQELNQILKGELSLDDVLPKHAKTAWIMIFKRGKDGKYRPNKEIVDHMLLCSQTWAMENLEMKIQRNLIDQTYQKREQLRSGPVVLQKGENHKTISQKEKEKNDPIILEKKRNKLRLYIAHMQGYDRDRDRDGGRGIDMTTGLVIDFGDIYIADKSHGSVIEDHNRDGIDLADIH